MLRLNHPESVFFVHQTSFVVTIQPVTDRPCVCDCHDNEKGQHPAMLFKPLQIANQAVVVDQPGSCDGNSKQYQKE